VADDNIRCHHCGVALTAANAVRREVVVARMPQLGDSMDTWARVDLCQRCAAEVDDAARVPAAGKSLVVVLAALGVVVCVIVLLLIVLAVTLFFVKL
jgi:hypothetical protein